MSFKFFEWCVHITPSIQHCTGGPEQGNKARKEIKCLKIRWQQVNLFT